MKILEFDAIITKIITNLRIRGEHYENHENHVIPYDNFENHENIKIPIENHEDHENPRIPCQNHKHNEIFRISYEHE